MPSVPQWSLYITISVIVRELKATYDSIRCKDDVTSAFARRRRAGVRDNRLRRRCTSKLEGVKTAVYYRNYTLYRNSSGHWTGLSAGTAIPSRHFHGGNHSFLQFDAQCNAWQSISVARDWDIYVSPCHVQPLIHITACEPVAGAYVFSDRLLKLITFRQIKKSLA